MPSLHLSRGSYLRHWWTSSFKSILRYIVASKSTLYFLPYPTPPPPLPGQISLNLFVDRYRDCFEEDNDDRGKAFILVQQLGECVMCDARCVSLVIFVRFGVLVYTVLDNENVTDTKRNAPMARQKMSCFMF